MKDSHEWVRQSTADRAADEVVAALGSTMVEVTPCQLARHLSCEPNGAFYANVRDWRQRRQDEMGLTTVDMPAGVETAFGAIIEQLATQAIDHFIRTVRIIDGDLDRIAAMRVADGERRCVEAGSETAVKLDRCQKAEAATFRIGALEGAQSQAQCRDDVLREWLDQRKVNAARHDTIVEPEDVAVAGVAEPAPRQCDANTPVQQAMPFHESNEAPE